jgi:hypothetical protein
MKGDSFARVHLRTGDGIAAEDGGSDAVDLAEAMVDNHSLEDAQADDEAGRDYGQRPRHA